MKAINLIGIMTGNSLDAADTVLTRFDPDGKMTDIAADSLPYPPALQDSMRHVRNWLKKENYAIGNIATHITFLGIVTAYTKLLVQGVENVLKKAGLDKNDVVAIGLHGQTCAHCPPSVSRDSLPYTVQIFHPKLLAKMTGIPVIYDFRSDDVFNGGEGAPLAPVHNVHMAKSLGLTGVLSFANAGNTGNLTIIDGDKAAGFDAGPFNHFPDLYARRFFDVSCDKDGVFGEKGTIRPDLLKAFFEQSALTASGDNFYSVKPPKSSDPQWYAEPEGVENFSPADVLRTAEYAAAYGLFYQFSFVENMPQNIVLFGGGWGNPLILKDFKRLINGSAAFVLQEHKQTFERIRKRFSNEPVMEKADAFGLNATYTEARIFADAAYRFIFNEPFTTPQTTGAFSATVCGVYCVPDDDKEYALQNMMVRKTPPERHPRLHSRASKLFDEPV